MAFPTDKTDEYDFRTTTEFPLPKAIPPLPKVGENSGFINSTGSTGMKYDGGKKLAGILFEDFPHALDAVVEIATYGAKKYARNSWLTVPYAQQRYKDALGRHQLDMGKGETYDDESKLAHAAHFAWNALAVLELQIRAGLKVKASEVIPVTGSGTVRSGRIELVEADRPDGT